MPSNEVDIKIKTSVDGDELESLNKQLKQLVDEEPKIKIGADTSEANARLKEVMERIGAIDNETVITDFKASGLDSITKQIGGAENSAGNFHKTVASGDGAWSTLKNSASGALDSILSGLESATSKMSGFLGSMSGIDRAFSGVLGAVGVNSINDLTLANAKAADTNKTLMKTMTNTSSEATSLWNASDKATNNSLMSMRELVPTMSAFQSQTGSSASEMELFAETASKLGSKSLALGYSAERTSTSVMSLGNGLEGAYAALDHLGITEQTLMDTGLWSGKEDDVEGYLMAVQAVTGDIDELMDTVEGKEKRVYKKLSTAGRELGEDMLPVLEGLYDGFLGLNEQTGGWIAKLTVGAGGAISTFAMVAPQLESSFEVLGRMSGQFKNLRESANAAGGYINLFKSKLSKVSSVFTNVGGKITGFKNTVATALSGAGSKISSFATTAGSKLKALGSAFVSSGRKALTAGFNYAKAGLMAAASAIKTGILTAATWLQTAAQTALNFVMALNPIFLIVMAIAALIAILGYLYFNNEQVRAAIDGLWAGLQMVATIIWGALIGAWNALVGALTGAYTAVVNFVTGAITWVSQLPIRIWSFLVAVISRVVSWGAQLVSRGKSAAMNTVNGIVSFFTQLPGKIYNAIKGVADKVKSVFASAGTAAWNAFVSALDSISGGLATIAINAVSGGNSAGSPYEMTYNNSPAAGSPFEEAVNNGEVTLPSKGTTVVNNFNSLVTERDVTNYIMNIVNNATELDKLRGG